MINRGILSLLGLRAQMLMDHIHTHPRVRALWSHEEPEGGCICFEARMAG